MTVTCPYCREPARLVPNSEVYGANVAHPANIWRCSPCDAHVGVSPGEIPTPIGTLANAPLRALRKRVHDALNGLPQTIHQSLAVQMGLDKTMRIKIAMLDVEGCLKLLALAGGDVESERYERR